MALTFGPTEIQSGGDDADWDYQTYSQTGTVLTVGGDNGTADEISAGWIFDVSASINSGDTINSATLTLVSDFSNEDLDSGKISGVDEDNRSSWADSSGNRPAESSNTGPTETTANLTGVSMTAAAGGTEYEHTVTSIVAEIVARAGFAGHIAFVCANNGGTIQFLKLAAFENTTDNPADLEIDYTAGGGGGISIPVAIHSYRQRRTPA